MRIIIILLFTLSCYGNISSKVQKFEWNGIEVTWLEDNHYPLYQVVVYFADGSLADDFKKQGESRAVFELLASGTNSYTKDQILSALEFYGSQLSHYVTHEYSTFEFSGLIKDIIPTGKMLCHLFQETNFPQSEVNNYILREKAKINNLINQQSELADSIFRKLSMEKTNLATSVDGTQKSLSSLTEESLKKKLAYYHSNVSKKIYIRGPREALKLEQVITKDCSWQNGVDSVRRVSLISSHGKKNPRMYYVTIPNSAQAQIRIGSYLPKDNFKNKDAAMALSSYFLGKGMGSLLVEEMRVKRGFVYYIDATLQNQNSYGRSVIMTSTSNKNLVESLEVIQNSLVQSQHPLKVNERLSKTKSFLKGHFLLSLDQKDETLRQIILFEHKGQTVLDLEKFVDKVDLLNEKQIAQINKDAFNWTEQTILILGSEKNIPNLKKKFPTVEVLDYKIFL